MNADVTLDKSVINQFGRFAITGGIGFLVEAVVLTLLVSVSEMNVYFARSISFSIAVTTTWLINRHFTFAGFQRKRKGKEYFLYFLVQTIGVLINLFVFFLVLSAYPELRSLVVIPLAAGSAVAMFFNFAASRVWIYNKRGQR